MMITIINKKHMCRYLFAIVLLQWRTQMTATANGDPDYYRYLQQFGYTPKIEGRKLFSVMAKSSYAESIIKFQRLFKLPVR